VFKEEFGIDREPKAPRNGNFETEVFTDARRETRRNPKILPKRYYQGLDGFGYCKFVTQLKITLN
jgi:hypothetical protein